MRQIKTDNVVRRQVVVYAPDHPMLAELREWLEAASDAEVFRISLRFLGAAAEDAFSGARLMVEPTDGDPFWLDFEFLRERAELDSQGPLENRKIFLSIEANDRVHFIRRIAGLGSDSEVVRYAARYTAILCDQAASGARFSVLDRDGRDTPVRMHGLPVPAPLFAPTPR